MALRKVAGSRLYIGSRVDYKTIISTSDFAGMAWTPIGKWTQSGDLGAEDEALTQTLIDQNVTIYGKGPISFPIMANTFVPDAADAGQIAFRVAQASCKPHAFKVEWGAECGPESTVTITQASPGVVTWTAHGLAENSPVTFSTTGTLPLPFLPGVTYYVRAQATNTFQLATTPGGASINTTTVGTGVHTARSVNLGDTDMFFGLAMRGSRTGGDASANLLVNMPIQPIAEYISV